MLRVDDRWTGIDGDVPVVPLVPHRDAEKARVAVRFVRTRHLDVTADGLGTRVDTEIDCRSLDDEPTTEVHHSHTGFRTKAPSIRTLLFLGIPKPIR